ncbi:uncharacterized protein L203_101387 [Cryptococcus depauperatus CBS 7841]|uniref:DDE Tnp4 domain-containing protein n=1 Tax=Cryptococcus depauperatus CBS 7841 TaxID=1295531 RepID=A0AAJ8JPU5_9TREE
MELTSTSIQLPQESVPRCTTAAKSATNSTLSLLSIHRSTLDMCIGVSGDLLFFKHGVKLSRVRVEHAIGILKLRWASLRNLPFRPKPEKDETQAYAFVQAVVILHNLLESIYLSVMNDQEVEEMMKEYRMQRNHDYGYNHQSSPVKEDYRRRELLTTQILEFYPERVDLENWT